MNNYDVGSKNLRNRLSIQIDVKILFNLVPHVEFLKFSQTLKNNKALWGKIMNTFVKFCENQVNAFYSYRETRAGPSASAALCSICLLYTSQT